MIVTNMFVEARNSNFAFVFLETLSVGQKTIEVEFIETQLELTIGSNFKKLDFYRTMSYLIQFELKRIKKHSIPKRNWGVGVFRIMHMYKFKDSSRSPSPLISEKGGLSLYMHMENSKDLPLPQRPSSLPTR
jgi:hypothetical protein